jgi:hypothetical protein
LKGEAHGRSGASRAGRTGGGRREGGSQTPDAARGGGGIRRHSSGSAGPRLCRRARKPRRGSTAGRVARPSGRWSDAAVRGCRGMSLKGRESARGASGRLRPRCRSGGRPPERRRNAHGSGGNRSSALVLRVRVPGAPRNPTRGSTGRRKAVSGNLSNPHTSGGSPRPRTWTPSSGFALTIGRDIQSSTDGRRRRVGGLGPTTASSPRELGSQLVSRLARRPA